MFFPISSTISTSNASKGSRKRFSLASFSSWRLAFLQLSGRDGDHLVGLLVRVLKNGEPEGDLAALHGHPGGLGDGAMDVLPARRVNRVGALLLAQAYGEHLRRAALYPSAKGGVRVNPVRQDHRVRLVGVLVHKDLDPRGCLPEQDRLHRGPNGASDHLLAHA